MTLAGERLEVDGRVYLHDGVYGVSTSGKAQAASGRNVHAFAPCSEPSIAMATAVAYEKLVPASRCVA